MSRIICHKCVNETGEHSVQLTNGLCFIEAPLDYGPRIMHYGFTKAHNVLANGLKISEPNGWKMLGGHRLWHSPEQYPRTYMPDNGPVEVELTDRGFRLIQAMEDLTQLIKSIEVIMEEDSARVTVIHQITNAGPWDISFSAWAITALPKEGIEIVPLNTTDSGYLPNQNVALWPGGTINDPRIKWGKKFVVLKQDSTSQSLKLGFNNTQAFAGYYYNDSLFIKKYVHHKEDTYCDFGSSYETFLCNDMIEMESLSPVKTVMPNQTITHVEEWNLIRAGEDELSQENRIEILFREHGYIGDENE